MLQRQLFECKALQVLVRLASKVHCAVQVVVDDAKLGVVALPFPGTAVGPHLRAHGDCDRVQHVYGLHHGLRVRGWLRQRFLYQMNPEKPLVRVERPRHGRCWPS